MKNFQFDLIKNFKLNALWQQALFALIFVYYIYVRWIHRNTLYWLDELSVVDGIPYNFWYFITKYLPTHEYHLPLPFLILYPIGHWISTDNRHLFASPYLVINVIFFWMFASVNWAGLLGVQIREKKILRFVNLLSSLLVTVNIHLIIHSLEVRPYSTLCLLALLSLIVSEKTLSQDRIKLPWIIFLSIIILFHNYGLLMVLLSFGFLTVRRIDGKVDGGFLRQLRPAYLMLFLSMLWTLPLLWGYYQLPVFNHFDLHHFVHINPYMFIQKGWRGALQVFAILYGAMGPWKLLRDILILGLGFGTLILVRRRNFVAISFPVFFVVIPIYLMYLFATNSGYYFVQRQFVWTMPFWAAYNAVCLAVFLDVLASKCSRLRKS